MTEVVRFANAHRIAFLAQSCAHGGTASLGALKHGIQIHMRRLNSLKVSADSTFATLGGGIKGVEVRDVLWKSGKWTVTGTCECPGHTAIALGGCHGILQGKYGLVSDQLLALNVVLANGTVVRVSKISHPDLFWAMQGAGHNFGIVTSINYKIYNIPEGGRIWSYEVLTYEATAENVKNVRGIAKRMLEEGSQPDDMLLYGTIIKSPEFGEKLVIMQHSTPLPTTIVKPTTITYQRRSRSQRPTPLSPALHSTLPRPLPTQRHLLSRNLSRHSPVATSSR